MEEIEERINRLWTEYVPRIEDARRRDGSDRHLHFLDLNEERIGDFPARPLTIEKWIILSECDSLVSGGSATFESVLRFLWIVSPSFSESPLKAKWFFLKNRKIDSEKTIAEIHHFLTRQFLFVPGTKGGKGGGKKGGSGEWVSSTIDLLASEYGWTIKSIMTMPISQVFLLATRIIARHSDTTPTFNSEADRLRDEFMLKADQMRTMAN